MNTSINNDVSGNEEVIAETSEDSNINQNEIVEEEASEEEIVSEVQIDYTSHFQMIEGLCFIGVTILIAIGCIIAWVGARYE